MFGKRLASLRKQQNLSQYQLANELEFSRGQVANYEQGKRQPDFATLIKLADYFDVSTDFLLCRTEYPGSHIKESRGTYKQHDSEFEIQLRGIVDRDDDTKAFLQQYLNAPEEKKKQIRDFTTFVLDQETR
ncbi:helix-turn-helix domain-containing protein [Caldalkalibacillus salinus]|uniref:helix-turn-helix domain-containing protein n=1 Tax=Caldalkalibacillus salinus TaxID=2803787 RepID=UPI0019251642|nr:helix-turn-helix transcriptional regulator [Caldalkalibacillus salinus]